MCQIGHLSISLGREKSNSLKLKVVHRLACDFCVQMAYELLQNKKFSKFKMFIPREVIKVFY